MSAVLTKASQVTCGHPGAGAVKLGAGAVKLRVKGQPVLRAEDLGPDINPGCKFQHPNPAGAVPCSRVVSLTAGKALKLRVAGAPVLLDTTQGVTNSTPTPGFLKVTANQQKLTAK